MIMNVRAVIVALVPISIVLLAGGISSAPETDTSFSPPGEEFDTLELVDRTFRPSTTAWIFIVEDEDGDALDQESLLEWKQNSDKLRADPEFSGALSTYFDGDAGLNVTAPIVWPTPSTRSCASPALPVASPPRPTIKPSRPSAPSSQKTAPRSFSAT